MQISDLALAATFLLLGACSQPLPQESVADGSIVGTEWRVVAYASGDQGTASVIGNTQMSARFGDDGRVTGNAGCNQFFADYALSDAALTVGPAGATSMFCAEPEGLMEQEAAYLGALRSATTLRRNGDALELRSTDGALAVVFTRLDND